MSLIRVILTALFVSAGLAYAATTFTLGETSSTGTANSGQSNALKAQNVTLSQPATIQSMSVYLQVANGRMRLGIYDATGINGLPGSLRAQTAEFSPITGWNTVTIDVPVVLPAGNYWLAFNQSSEANTMRAKTTAGQSSKIRVMPYGPLPLTFGTPTGVGATHRSLYATMCSM